MDEIEQMGVRPLRLDTINAEGERSAMQNARPDHARSLPRASRRGPTERVRGRQSNRLSIVMAAEIRPRSRICLPPRIPPAPRSLCPPHPDSDVVTGSQILATHFFKSVRRPVSLEVKSPPLPDWLKERFKRIQPARRETEVAEPILGAMDLVAPKEEHMFCQ